jgi:3-dehydroquinate synthase
MSVPSAANAQHSTSGVVGSTVNPTAGSVGSKITDNSSIPASSVLPASDRIDLTFSVPCTFRLRFTTDVFGREPEELLYLLAPSGDQPPRVQFWVDEHVAAAQPSLMQRIEAFVQAFPHRIRPVGLHPVPGGEAVKNDPSLIERFLQAFNAADLDRRSYVVVIGGGAVLDAVGFAAATAHRGIRLVRLPTTTLAQADSGVGVKNAINYFGKKNWLGCFAVPWAVLNDAALLSSLPDRDFVCGFSEAVKVTLLKSPAGFERLCRDAVRIRRRDLSAAMPAIRISAEMHLAHITTGGDPFEALEARPLDFGHWSAHKMEAMSGFQLPHGEAVGIGVAVDTVYSSLRHGLPAEDADRVLRCLADLGLPLDHPALHDSSLFSGLEEFRQHLGGRLTLTMLRGIGQPLDVHSVDRGAMQEAIHRVAQFARDNAANGSGR